MSVTLICPVRDCGRELHTTGAALACEARHSFDVARSGYVNLLQPQDRKSDQPGDSPAAVEARARFLAQFGDPIAAPLASAVRKIARKRPILDVGCGVGFHLDTLRQRLQAPAAYGVDLAVAAVERAARTYRSCSFIVANADRFIPFADRSFSAIFSITARRNASEFARLLNDGGVVAVALPAADDLAELREVAQGEAVLRDRTEALVTEMAGFEVIDAFCLSRTVPLERAAIDDLLAATYRGARHAERSRLGVLDQLEVTISRDIVLFKKL